MADISKASGYAVTGGSDTSAIVTKLTAYAVTDTPSTVVTISKLVGYTVIVDSSNNARPQVFVCT
jgi:hypothetical protein